MATNIGPKIGIEGEKEYRDALKNIIQQTKTLGSEMEAVAASFGKNADAQEKLPRAALFWTSRSKHRRHLLKSWQKPYRKALNLMARRTRGRSSGRKA